MVEAIDENDEQLADLRTAQATLVKCVLSGGSTSSKHVKWWNGVSDSRLWQLDIPTDLTTFKLLCTEAGDLAFGMDSMIDDKFLFGTDFAAIARINGYTQVMREAHQSH